MERVVRSSHLIFRGGWRRPCCSGKEIGTINGVNDTVYERMNQNQLENKTSISEGQTEMQLDGKQIE